MALYAISDLHLSFQSKKPMDVFGESWKNHHEKIEKSWRSMILPEDTILIPGDLSWAMRLSEAIDDFEFLHSLPGKKIIGRGNHDYYWHSHQKMVEFLPKDIIPIDRRVIELENRMLVSTKGWLCPGASSYVTSQDEKYYRLEAQRLEMVLEKAKECDKELISMLHFPPMNEKNEESLFTDLLEEYGVRLCIFGHLHGQGLKNKYDFKQNGVQYQLVSADYLEFAPLLLDPLLD